MEGGGGGGGGGGSCVKIMVAMQCKGLVKSGEIKTE